MTFSARDYVVVNAFAETPFGGNPAAVFPDARELPEESLQLIARQLNLVETVFVFPSPESGVDARLRYFTPDEELPVAGHPTIAAWVALAHLGTLDVQRTSYIQKTRAGRQTIHVLNTNGCTRVRMEQIAPKFLRTLDDRREVASVFSVDERDLLSEFPVLAVDIGLGHLIAGFRDLAALRRVRRNMEPLLDLCTRAGVREAQLFCFETVDSANSLHTRNICPREGLEDPACGNGSAALGAYFARTDWMPGSSFRFRAEQGHVVHMPSVVEVEVERGEVPRVSLVGGGVPMIKGTLVCDLPGC